MKNEKSILSDINIKLEFISRRLIDLSLQKNPTIQSHINEINNRVQNILQILENENQEEYQLQQMRKQFLSQQNKQPQRIIESDILYSYNLEFLNKGLRKDQQKSEIQETCHSIIINQTNINDQQVNIEQQKLQQNTNYTQQNQQLNSGMKELKNNQIGSKSQMSEIQIQQLSQQQNVQTQQINQNINKNNNNSPNKSDSDGDEKMYSAISSLSKIKQQSQQSQQQQQYQQQQQQQSQIKQSQIKQSYLQQEQLPFKDELQQKQFNSNLTKSKQRIYNYNVKPELYTKMKQDMNKYTMNIVEQPLLSEDGSISLCPICQDSSFTDSNQQEGYVIQLICSHQFHYVCLQPLLKNNFLKCPVCNKIIGQVQGDQPDGIMEVSTIRQKCTGYRCDTIQIIYKIHSGIRNGKHYIGTTRYAYLPENNEGKHILSLLRKAFDQKLVFTIGTSLTTGQENCVIWNGIHHKTSLDGGPQNYGYPDPTYFERVLDELKQKGITQSMN